MHSAKFLAVAAAFFGSAIGELILPMTTTATR